MTRLACLILSLALHAGLLFLALSGPEATSPTPDAPDAAVPVVSLPPGEETPPSEPAADAPPPQSAPQPQGPSAASAARPVSPGPDLPPDMAVISPVKRNMRLPPPIHVGRGQLKTGKESSMTLRRMAGYDFTLDEFCGRYEVSGEPGRFVDVTRHPGDAAALILRDTATGTVRTLRRFSKFIFTYGPAFYENEPVEGSITFLARKDFERIADVDERSRILWQADQPPARVAVRLDGPAPPPARVPSPDRLLPADAGPAAP